MATYARRGWQLTGNSADAYEAFMVPAIFAVWAEPLVELAGLRSGDRVLDLACGTGVIARRAVDRVLPAGEVTGVDVNSAMLATARQSAGDDSPIEWREADALELPFPDGSFDAVFCQQGLQFMVPRDGAAREMRRVLGPGGRVAAAVWCGLEHNRAFALFAEALGRHSAQAGEVMRSPFGWGDRDALGDLLAAAGFDQVRVVADTRISRFPSPTELLRQEALSSPLAEPLAQLDEQAFAALVADVEETLAEYVDDGLAVPMRANLVLASIAS
jgi:SAM-dependent methyltransferase